MDAFEQAALTLTQDVNLFKPGEINSGGVVTYPQIRIDYNVEIISADNLVSYETTATFKKQDFNKNSEVTADGKTWETGRTLSDDGLLMTVVLQ